MHFVEDQNGKVQDVVNMTEQGQANVETTLQMVKFKSRIQYRGFFSIYNHMEKKSGNIEEFNFNKNNTFGKTEWTE